MKCDFVMVGGNNEVRYFRTRWLDLLNPNRHGNKENNFKMPPLSWIQILHRCGKIWYVPDFIYLFNKKSRRSTTRPFSLGSMLALNRIQAQTW